MNLQEGDWVIVHDPAGISDPNDNSGVRFRYPYGWVHEMDFFIGKICEVMSVSQVPGKHVTLMTLPIYGTPPGSDFRECFTFTVAHLEKVEKPSEEA